MKHLATIIAICTLTIVLNNLATVATKAIEAYTNIKNQELSIERSYLIERVCEGSGKWEAGTLTCL